MVSLLLPAIYLAFISLGLPDALLGAAWPSMYLGLGAGLSWAGMISMIISAGTVVSGLAPAGSRPSAWARRPQRCLAFPPARRSGSFVCGPCPTAWARAA